MEEAIGIDAGRIYEHLESCEQPVTPSALAKALGMKLSAVHRGLGWLARESKLEFHQRYNVVRVALKQAAVAAA